MDFSIDLSEDIIIARLIIRKATFLEALQFQNLLTNEIDKGYIKAVIDLSNCSSIDPAFFSAIITIYKKLIYAGGNLKLVKPTNYLDDYERFENNLRVFEFFNSKEEAIESYRMIFTQPVDLSEQYKISS
ncbi:MAG: STAS domain-containing protein [Ignavibacteriaceae bacterium]|nr:STAS domain-containing protein [Ignavibacteriaceae bacterium]